MSQRWGHGPVPPPPLRPPVRLRREAFHQKARLGIMIHRAMSLLRLVPYKTVMNGEYYQMSILANESLDAD